MKIFGIIFILIGVLLIISNKRAGESCAEFQKGWGLEGHTAIVVDRLINVIGGLMFLGVGLLLLFK